jgi:hypothetical protein
MGQPASPECQEQFTTAVAESLHPFNDLTETYFHVRSERAPARTLRNYNRQHANIQAFATPVSVQNTNTVATATRITAKSDFRDRTVHPGVGGRVLGLWSMMRGNAIKGSLVTTRYFTTLLPRAFGKQHIQSDLEHHGCYLGAPVVTV